MKIQSKRLEKDGTAYELEVDKQIIEDGNQDKELQEKSTEGSK